MTMDLLNTYRLRKMAGRFIDMVPGPDGVYRAQDAIRRLPYSGPTDIVRYDRFKKLKKRGLLAAAALAVGGLGYGAYKAGKKGDNTLADSLTTDPEMLKTLGYTGGGALAGGLAGGLLSKENKLRNALIGAALGGLGGYAADWGRRKYTGE